MLARPSSPPGKDPSTSSVSPSAPASHLLRPIVPPDDEACPFESYQFMYRLGMLVNDSETDGVISWNDDGSGFIIHQPFLFEKELLHIHFQLSTLSGFVRYLTSRIGFEKVEDGWEFSKQGFRRKESDGYRWRKTLQSNNTMASYRCAHPGCSARKESLNGKRTPGVIYRGSHSHPKPQPDVLVLPHVHKGATTSVDLLSALGTGKCSDSSAVESGSYSSAEKDKNPKSSLWSVEEHQLFLLGLQKLRERDWPGISRQFVVTKTPNEVAKHATKYLCYQSLAASQLESESAVSEGFPLLDPWLLPVPEESCVTTEPDEFETVYDEDNAALPPSSEQTPTLSRARQISLKRFREKRADRLSRGKRSAEGGDDKEQQQLERRSPVLASVTVDALKADGLQKLCSSLEPTIHGLASTEVSCALAKLGPQDPWLLPVPEESCVTTEPDEFETVYDEDISALPPSCEQTPIVPRARQTRLKRFLEKRADRLSRGKRSVEGGDDEEQQRLKRRSPVLASATVDTLKADGLQKLCSLLEPTIHGLASTEVACAFSKLGSVGHNRRSSCKQIEGPGERNLQLHFRTELSGTLFTGVKLESKKGAAVCVALLDANSGHVVTSGPEASIKLDVVVLDDLFDNEDDEGWTHKEFETHVVIGREGRRPLLAGDLQITLKEGVGTLGDLTFTDNSSWTRNKRFRLGLKVASGFSEGIRIREAKTEAFVVQDYRGEGWRLKMIAKGGAFHQGLANVEEVQGAHTVGSTGRKDRYNKIFTAQGVKGRRIRLSVHTAIRIYDLQDRLGYDKPSKIVDWLIEKSKAAIDKLPELPAWEPSATSSTKIQSAATQSPQCVEEEPQKSQQQEPQQSVCGSWWDLNSPGDSFTFQHQLNPSTGLHQTSISFTCKPIDPQGARPHLTFLQGPADIKEVPDGNIFGSTASKDSHSKVCTAKGVRDCHVQLPVHTAIQFYDLQDRLGYDRPSKAVDWLIEAAKAAIDELAEFSAQEPSATKNQSVGASQPPQHEEEGPRKSQHQQETQQSGCGSGWDFSSLVDFFTFQQQLDPSAGHHPCSGFVLPTLDSDAIADFIKSSPMGSTDRGGDSATSLSQNLFQSHPVLGLLEHIEGVQNMLCISRITKNDLDADSMIRILGMSKLKVHNLFSKVPKPLPSIYQADNFVELHLPRYNHRLLWAGKLALVNLRLINLKRSLKLISLPDLSMAQKIVHLNLRGCVKLIQVSYIRNLAKLEELDMSNCENIRILPSLVGLQNLKEFYLSGCSNLRELPPSIRALKNLAVLDLKNCAQLYELPSITSGLRSLQKLNISGCTNILRSLDMKGSRGSLHSYGRLLRKTICKNGYSSSTGKASEFVDGVASHEQKKCTTKKAKKNSATEVVQVEVSEERELTIKNFNCTAAMKMEEDERKRKSVESTAKTGKEVRVKRSCNNLDDSVSSICQPSHEPEAVENFSDGQSRESKLIDFSVPAYRSSAVLGCGHILTGSAPEAVEEAIIDSGSKLIGDTEPAPTDPAPTLNKSTFTRTAVEDSTSRDSKDVGLGIQMQLEAISLGNSGLQPLEECTERLALDVSKAAASCDPHKSAEKLRDGGNKSNSEVFNHQPKETESLASYEENGESDWLKEEIQKLQEQLAASEKRREGICEHYDSLESELWPLPAELEVEHVNLKEQKQRHEEREQEASIAWEDLKKLVAEVAFDYDTIF